MTCDPVRFADGPTAIICSRARRGTRKTCALCEGRLDRLCDYPVTRRGRRCSRALCEEHAHEVGEHDYCPEHYAALVERRRRTPPLVCGCSGLAEMDPASPSVT